MMTVVAAAIVVAVERVKDCISEEIPLQAQRQPHQYYTVAGKKLACIPDVRKMCIVMC